MAEEIQNEEQAPEPTKKAKKEKKSGDKMSTGTIIGIVAGVVLLQVILIFVVVKYFFSSPVPEEGEGGGEANTEQVSSGPKPLTDEQIEAMEFTAEKERIIRFNTDRITTNPKNNDKSLVVLAFTLKMLPHEDVPEESLAEGGPIMTEIKDEILHTILTTVGAMTKEEILEYRHELPAMLKEELKNKLLKYNIYLLSIYNTEFIMQ